MREGETYIRGGCVKVGGKCRRICWYMIICRMWVSQGGESREQKKKGADTSNVFSPGLLSLSLSYDPPLLFLSFEWHTKAAGGPWRTSPSRIKKNHHALEGQWCGTNGRRRTECGEAQTTHCFRKVRGDIVMYGTVWRCVCAAAGVLASSGWCCVLCLVCVCVCHGGKKWRGRLVTQRGENAGGLHSGIQSGSEG